MLLSHVLKYQNIACWIYYKIYVKDKPLIKNSIIEVNQLTNQTTSQSMVWPYHWANHSSRTYYVISV